MVVHMSAGEKQNGDQTYSRPQVPVLDDWKNVRCCNCAKRDYTKDRSDCNHDAAIVDRSDNWWAWSFTKMALDPSIDVISRLGTTEKSE